MGVPISVAALRCCHPRLVCFPRIFTTFTPDSAHFLFSSSLCILYSCQIVLGHLGYSLTSITRPDIFHSRMIHDLLSIYRIRGQPNLYKRSSLIPH